MGKVMPLKSHRMPSSCKKFVPIEEDEALEPCQKRGLYFDFETSESVMQCPKTHDHVYTENL